MSYHGYPGSGGPLYPQVQGHGPSPGAPPRPATGPGQGSSPYPQQGQGYASFPQQNQAAYPQQAYGQQPYQSLYPQQGQATPPQHSGAAPYTGQQSGAAPYPGKQSGAAPYPGQQFGAAPYPGQQPGAASYPGQQPGAAPYPGQQPGAVPYPGQQPGAAPYPGQQPGAVPYPGQQPGAVPYPGQQPGAAPHPRQQPGVAPHPGQQPGASPYPGQQPGAAPYPGQKPGAAPYPGQQPGGAPYPGQQGGHGTYNNQTQLPQNYTSQGQASSQAHNSHPGVNQFKSRVEIHIECKNLLNKDIMSKSDPCAAFYIMNAGRWLEVGRTENVINCLNPRFSKSFVVNYFFEEVQKVLIAVYDIDNITPQLTDDDFLGQIETTLGQIVSNNPLTAPLVLRNGARAGQGTITIRSQEIKEGSETAALTFRAQKLDSKDFFGKSDPYLEIQRATPDGSWQVVHRTEVVKNNLNPTWRPFQVPLQALCGGNRQQSIKIDCYDWDSDGSHDFIGSFTTTFDEMFKASKQEVSFACINPSMKAKKKNYQNSGIILLTSCKLIKEHTFLDYITSGTQINFTVGIDFTASNGDPSKSSSLHYINPYQPNEYSAAIKAVGDVCQDYDSDKLFPALGFGAKIPPRWEVSHEFALTFNAQNPYCQGIDGVLQAYMNCIRQVQLYGPTNAAPIINHVANFASGAQREESAKGAHAYFILLMLTDGVLSDMSNTKHAIVQASKLPMSLIIVGVGQADFQDMQELDGDNGVLRAPSGEACKRDIVQFVPFRDFRNSSPVELARHVLAEVPKQVTDYYKMRGMQPNAQRPA